MHHFTKTLALAALVAVGTAACSEQPTEPTSTFSVDLLALDDFGFMSGFGPGPGCASGPGTCFTGTGSNQSYLGTLVREAYQKLVTTQGQEAADAAFATLWQLHQDAFALRSGSHDAFVAAMQAAHAEAVRIVIDVLGVGSASTVIQLATDKLNTLLALIAEQEAAGADVTRLQYLADRVTSYLTDAKAKLAAGDAAAALDLASRALQAATVGAGQNAANGGGMQYRGGR